MEEIACLPQLFKNEEGLYHVKTEHTSPQKRYKTMRGNYTLRTGVFSKTVAIRILTVHDKMVLKKKQKGTPS